MKLLTILSLFVIFISDVNSQGVCTDSDLSINLDKGNIYGTEEGGFRISCQYTFTESYDLYLWRIEKANQATYDFVYTYFTGTNPPTSQPGTNYVDRQIKFENNDTIVFGSMYSNDTGTYRCTVQFNAAAAECTESTSLKLIAKPVVFKDLPECLCYGTEERIPVAATDFLTPDMTSTQFILNIDGSNITLDTSVNDQNDGFKSFNSSIQYTASKDIEVTLFMIVGNSGVTVDKRKMGVPNTIPFLVVAAILDGLQVAFIVVIIVLPLVGKTITVKVRQIFFASSIVIIVIGIIFVAVVAVTACIRCGVAIAAIAISAVAIILGIVGVILAFKWKSEDNKWICNKTKK